jgi:hypothetical protein
MQKERKENANQKQSKETLKLRERIGEKKRTQVDSKTEAKVKVIAKKS